jgi:hypothetical protein
VAIDSRESLSAPAPEILPGGRSAVKFSTACETNTSFDCINSLIATKREQKKLPYE